MLVMFMFFILNWSIEVFVAIGQAEAVAHVVDVLKSLR
jgi:hypothetical protein